MVIRKVWKLWIDKIWIFVADFAEGQNVWDAQIGSSFPKFSSGLWNLGFPKILTEKGSSQ